MLIPVCYQLVDTPQVNYCENVSAPLKIPWSLPGTRYVLDTNTLYIKTNNIIFKAGD